LSGAEKLRLQPVECELGRNRTFLGFKFCLGGTFFRAGSRLPTKLTPKTPQ
jgi:hypothetical protein